MTPERDLISSEAAGRLGVSPVWVRRLCQRGELPGAVKRGRDWWIPVTAVETYAATRRPPGNPSFGKRQP